MAILRSTLLPFLIFCYFCYFCQAQQIQQYLPKVSSYLPMSDIYGRDIARSGRDTFFKVNKNGRSTIISTYPVRPNCLTKVTFYLQAGNYFHLTVGKKDRALLRQGDTCKQDDKVTLITVNGNKCIETNQVQYI